MPFEETGPTTNEADKQRAAELVNRLKTTTQNIQDTDDKTINNISDSDRIPDVEIAEGRHKYVLIKAIWNKTGDIQYIVTSRYGASYHNDAAEPMVAKLQRAGDGRAYSNIEITGGGRINCNSTTKEIEIYGYSYSFGQAVHEISQNVIQNDSRYSDYKITWNNDGY